MMTKKCETLEEKIEEKFF